MRFERFTIAGVFVAGLLLRASPALADYECVAEAFQGDRDLSSVHQRVSAIAYDRDFRSMTILRRVLNYGVMPGVGRRWFQISASGPLGGFVKPDWLNMDYTASLKPSAKPLFVFLVLDSGEYVQSLVIDARGRRWFGERENTLSSSPNRVVVSFTVKDAAFLGAFERAKTMAVELKYADGETLTRETFDVTRPDELIERTLNAAKEMQKDYEKKCKVYLPEIEI